MQILLNRPPSKVDIASTLEKCRQQGTMLPLGMAERCACTVCIESSSSEASRRGEQTPARKRANWIPNLTTSTQRHSTPQTTEKHRNASHKRANDDDDERGEEDQSYFAVNLFVAALGDGKLLPTGSRKKQDTLEQVVRNESK